MQELKGTEKKKIQDFTFWTNWFFCWIYQIRHFPSPEWRYIPTYLRRCPSLACLDGRCLSKVPSVVWMTKKDFIFNAKRWTQDGQTDQFWWSTKPREFYFINFITLSLSLYLSLSLSHPHPHIPLCIFSCAQLLLSFTLTHIWLWDTCSIIQTHFRHFDEHEREWKRLLLPTTTTTSMWYPTYDKGKMKRTFSKVSRPLNASIKRFQFGKNSES